MKQKRYLELAWMPILLTILMVGETLLFNHWLDIESRLYIKDCIIATISLGFLLFFPATFFSKRSSRYIYLLAVSVAVMLIFVSQYLYFSYSGGFLQASALAYANQTVDLLGTIKTLLTYKLLLFFLPLVLLFVTYFFGRRVDSGTLKLSWKEKSCAVLIALLLCAGGYLELYYSERLNLDDISSFYSGSEMYSLSGLVSKVGIVNFYIESLVQFAIEPNIANNEDKIFLTKWAADRTLPPQGSDFGALKGKNLIFLQVESLEDWVIGYKINGVLVAPNLTALAQQGEYFSNYYSQIGLGNTADAEFSTLNSLYPLPDSVAFITHPNNKSLALPRLLDDNGYTTAVLHGDVATFWNRSNAYPPIGYEKIFSQKDYTIPRQVGFEGLGDDDFFKESLPKLESLPQPFMATLITLSTHTPFTIPSDLQTLKIPSDTTLTPTQQQYLEAVHYSDQAIGDLIAGLKKDGLYNSSLIAIYGDHAAFIGTPDSQIQHVPLILLSPDANLKGTNATPASHLDLYPTVADLLGIQYPISVLGQDALTTTSPLVTQRVAGTGSIKFILTPTLKYTASAHDVFDHGTCLALPASTTLPIADCEQLYDEQATTTQASDMVVRYNLLSILNPAVTNAEATTATTTKPVGN